MFGHLSYFFSQRRTTSIGLLFLCNSFLFGNWVTRIPDFKDQLLLSESTLGLALLGAPLGALCIMPVSGWVIARFQLGRTVVVTGLFHSLALPFLTMVDSFWALFLALFYFGYTNSIMDISMNAAAAVTEKKLGRPIMSTCHGMWSIGAMLGAGIGSLFLAFELPSDLHLMVIGLVVGVILMILAVENIKVEEKRQLGEKLFALPRGLLLLLAFIAFFAMLSEGAIADWSAIYMRDSLLAEPHLVGLAFSGFALFMSVGRLSGDALIPKIGSGRIIVLGGILACFGLAAAILTKTPYLAILGFSLAGLGYSCIIPVVFMAAANVQGYASGTGIAAVTTIGYSGFLIGPPFIGFLAEGYGMNMGLVFIAFCSALVTIIAARVKFG